MSEVTRGRVDNENNNQSRYSNISNIVHRWGFETVILRSVLVIPEFECRTKFQESRESVEAVIAVLQGLMSSEWN